MRLPITWRLKTWCLKPSRAESTQQLGNPGQRVVLRHRACAADFLRSQQVAASWLRFFSGDNDVNQATLSVERAAARRDTAARAAGGAYWISTVSWPTVVAGEHGPQIDHALRGAE